MYDSVQSAVEQRPVGAFVEVRVLEGRPAGAPREDVWDYEVVVTEEGLSLNGRYYPKETLEQAVPLLDGVPVQAMEVRPGFLDHLPEALEMALPGLPLGNKVGELTNPRFGEYEVEEVDPATGQRRKKKKRGLLARLHIYRAAKWFKDLVDEALERGRPTFGFSINADGVLERRTWKDRVVDWVRRITRFFSVDAVSEPAAGGLVLHAVKESWRIQRLYSQQQLQLQLQPRRGGWRLGAVGSGRYNALKEYTEGLFRAGVQALEEALGLGGDDDADAESESEWGRLVEAHRRDLEDYLKWLAERDPFLRRNDYYNSAELAVNAKFDALYSAAKGLSKGDFLVTLADIAIHRVAALREFSSRAALTISKYSQELPVEAKRLYRRTETRLLGRFGGAKGFHLADEGVLTELFRALTDFAVEDLEMTLKAFAAGAAEGESEGKGKIEAEAEAGAEVVPAPSSSSVAESAALLRRLAEDALAGTDGMVSFLEDYNHSQASRRQ